MSLKKRLFTSSGAAGSDGYTDNLTSWVQVGTGKSWEGSGTSMTDLSSNNKNFTLQGGYSYSSGNKTGVAKKYNNEGFLILEENFK